jgi:serine/threonine-protein kinase RsbW
VAGQRSWTPFVRAGAPGWTRLVLRLTADSDAATTARRAVGDWLRGHRVRPELIADIVLATSELVDNATEHAYPADRPGPVTLLAHLSRRHLFLEISDTGAWRAPTTGPSHRGRGLAMLRAVADTVKVEHSDAGTLVSASLHAQRTPAHA